MDICQHDKRVVSKLFELHENLKNEHAQIGTTISNEILKCKLEVAEYKAKMEVASLNFEMQLQMQKNKFNSKETKHRFALACLLILFAVMMFYPVSNANSSRLRLH
jgi:dipeptide/tripeptide permease